MLAGTMAVVSGMDNVHLYVRDMGRSLRFYRDVLGIALAGDDHWSDAPLGGVRFALHATPDGVEPAMGTIFVSLAVADASAARDHVRAAGYEALELTREEYGTSFEALDPDGYRIHLLQPTS